MNNRNAIEALLLTCAISILSGLWFVTAATAQQPAVSKAPPEIVTRPFEDWRVECRLPAANGLKCQIVQQLLHATLKKSVLAITIAYSPKKKRDAIQIVLPLGFLIKPGVDLDISSYKTRAGIDRCTVQGCFIEGFAEKAMIDMMKRTTRQGMVSFVTSNGQKTAIRFSLRGFAGAYGYMRNQNLSHIRQSSKPAKTKTIVKKKRPAVKRSKKRTARKSKKPKAQDTAVTPSVPGPAVVEDDARNWFDRKQDDPSL